MAATKKKAVKKSAPQTEIQKLKARVNRLEARLKKIEDVVGAEGTPID